MPLYVFSRTDTRDDDKAVEAARTRVAAVGAKVVSTAAGSLVLVVEADQFESIKRTLPDWQSQGESMGLRAS